METLDGRSLRRQVLGTAHAEAAVPEGDGTSSAFVELAERNVWDGIWSRPGLGARERSLCTIVLMIAGGHLDELALHLAGALRNGWWTREELVEVCLHSSGYCGFPVARSALNVLIDLAPEEKQ